MALLTIATLTVATLTVATLTVATPTMALLTMAILTMAASPEQINQGLRRRRQQFERLQASLGLG